jgi:MFS family permease
VPLTRRLATTASPEELEAALRDGLGARRADDGQWAVDVPFPVDGSMPVTLTVHPGPDGGPSEVVAEAGPPPRIPWFGWVVAPFLFQARARAVRHALAVVEAHAAGAAEPPPPGRVLLSPPVPFTADQIAHLLTVAALVAVAGFGSSLFSQQVDYIGDAFHASDGELGVALAAARVGVLASLVAATLADRVGRRRILIWGTTTVCAANVVSAVAPDLWTYTASQVVTRAAVNAVAVVAAVAVLEDAPERARAWAIGVLGLAGGTGFGVAVLFLPLADLGTEAWRITYVISAGLVVLVPPLARALPESTRFTRLATARRGRVADVLAGVHRRRFFLLASAAFAGQIFVAPAAQFANRYLQDDRGFSGFDISVFRVVTAGVPGLLGVLVGGYLADTRGRKPVAIIASVAATATAMVLFLTDGVVLWIAGTLSSTASSLAAPAVGAIGTEMFPTRFRATAQSMLLLVGVLGSATGLLIAGGLSDPLGGIGPATAVLGVLPILAALLLIPPLPEPAMLELDDVSEHDPTAVVLPRVDGAPGVP